MAAQALEKEGVGVRVVSLPCVERFLSQPEAYRGAVMARGTPVLAVEAGHPAGLASVLPPGSAVIGISTFGQSAPGPQLMQHFGFTVDNVVARARQLLDA